MFFFNEEVHLLVSELYRKLRYFGYHFTVLQDISSSC